jgi:hypothetical protein
LPTKILYGSLAQVNKTVQNATVKNLYQTETQADAEFSLLKKAKTLFWGRESSGEKKCSRRKRKREIEKTA